MSRISQKKGDTFGALITIKKRGSIWDDVDDPAMLLMQMWRRSPNNSMIRQFVPQLVSGGVFQVHEPKSVTKAWDPMTYVTDIQITMPDNRSPDGQWTRSSPDIDIQINTDVSRTQT